MTAMTEAYVETPAEFFAVVFTTWRDKYDVHGATSEFSDVPGTRYFVNGYAGYGIRPDGDLVFVHAWRKGEGAALVADAVARGAETLDCFDGYLPTLYAQHGFVEYAREANWTPGGPDVVFMALPSRP